MPDRKVAMVVASNREEHFREFMEVWYGRDKETCGFPWDITILVQDGGGPAFKPEDRQAGRAWHGLVRHDWSSIRATNGADLPDWLARQDSGIKAWGFLDAVGKHEADVVITLDDDCLPCALGADPSWHRKKDVEYRELVEAARTGFVERHLEALYSTRRWTTTIPGFIPRGMPYGTQEDGKRQPRLRGNSLGELAVALNMGIWSAIPDRDAVHELTNWTPEGYYKVWRPRKSVYRHSRVMSPDQYWPLCGMNMAFRRELAPLMYFPRMGEDVFRRFDDIWCGVIAQKCMRHLRLSAAVGGPIISHEKASRPMDNLVRESPGIRANEEFWRVIDGIELTDVDNTPLRCMGRVGVALAEYRGGVRDEPLGRYLPKLGLWILAWCERFIKAGWEL